MVGRRRNAFECYGVGVVSGLTTVGLGDRGAGVSVPELADAGWLEVGPSAFRVGVDVMPRVGEVLCCASGVPLTFRPSVAGGVGVCTRTVPDFASGALAAAAACLPAPARWKSCNEPSPG